MMCCGAQFFQEGDAAHVVDDISKADPHEPL